MLNLRAWYCSSEVPYGRRRRRRRRTTTTTTTTTATTTTTTTTLPYVLPLAAPMLSRPPVQANNRRTVVEETETLCGERPSVCVERRNHIPPSVKEHRSKRSFRQRAESPTWRPEMAAQRLWDDAECERVF